MGYFGYTPQSSTCSFCQKLYAYVLPLGDWYRPPLLPNPPWTITTTDHTTMLTFTGNANTQPNPSPLDYCYGHTFVTCADCGCLVPYMWHSPASCAVLRGMMQGIQELRASLEEPAPYGISRVERLMQETMPVDECLPEHVDVPNVFQEAFEEVL